MKMINKILIIIFVLVSAVFFVSCGGGGNDVNKPNAPESTVKINVGSKPLNISIYLDLSDRLMKTNDDTGDMTQTEKDTAIVNHIADIFYSTVVKKKEKQVVDKLKVLFYPTPTIPAVNALSKSLMVDLSSSTDKLGDLTAMKESFHSTLGQIYEHALDGKIKPDDFIGSDLWGFFNEKADDQCLAKDYRNILVILTDGYVYHEKNIVTQVDGCSYISAKTLKNGIPLIVDCDGLNDLEVLVLEANPNPNTDFPKLKRVLETWLKGMGVEKCRVVKTDIPTTTFQSIDKFFEQ